MMLGQEPPAGCSLSFVHIPKTGGTAIEVAALRRGLRWGTHDPELMSRRGSMVRTSSKQGANTTWLKVCGSSREFFRSRCCNAWHVPLRIPALTPRRWAFCVVRDVAQRITSQYFMEAAQARYSKNRSAFYSRDDAAAAASRYVTDQMAHALKTPFFRYTTQ